MSVETKICFFALFFLIIGAFGSVCSNRVLAVGEAETRQIIIEAQSAVTSGYVSVTDAQKVGANVTDLLVTLNNANDLLSQSQLAFENASLDGNYEVPYALASQCLANLTGFDTKALILKNNAAEQGHSDFMIYVVGSFLGTIIVVLSSYTVWGVLKKRIEKGGCV